MVDLAILELQTKFEVSRCTRYEAMNGGAKFRKWGGLGSLKVIGNVTIRYRAHTTSYIQYSTLTETMRLLYRFLLRCSQLFVESRRCQTTHLHLAPPSNFASAEKCSPWAIVWRCLRDSMFSGFCTIPACDRRTDEQTDGLTSDTVTAYGASIASLGKNRIAGTYDCQLVVY